MVLIRIINRYIKMKIYNSPWREIYMSAKWEKQEGNNGVLTIEVEAKTFDEALGEVFKKVSQDVQVPGFRKGKIPRKMYEQRFGVESMYQDAVDVVLPDAYRKALEETGIEPIAQPDINIEEIGQGKTLVVTANVTVKPEVKLGEYKGLEVKEEKISVTDEEVEKELEAQREKLAELIIKEEGKIEDGNTVVIDFEGFLDGEAFEGGKGENHSLEIGSGEFIPGFEEQLVGKESGIDTEVEITFPEDYHAEDLSGKDAVFQVKIHEIKIKELPELDDEFAKDVDDSVDTLEELKQKKKTDLENQKIEEADNEKRESLITQAAANATVDVPAVMVETELEQMVREFEQRLEMQGMNMEMYAQFSGQGEDDLREQMSEDAEKRVKTNLTLEAISEKEALEVSEEDVDAELEKMSKIYGTEVEQLKQMLGGNTDSIKSDLHFRKSIDFLVEHSKTI